MFTASFEAMYSGFSRMHVQKTWDAIMNAPLTIDDVVAGESCGRRARPCSPARPSSAWCWCSAWRARRWVLLALPAAFLIGLAFAGSASS